MSDGRLVQNKIKRIQAKVPYATVEDKLIFSVEVSEEAIVREAVELPGIGDHLAHIKLDQIVIGIFSKPLNGKMLPMPGDYYRARRSDRN